MIPDSKAEIDHPDKSGAKILAGDDYYQRNSIKTKYRIQKLLFPEHIVGFETNRSLITDSKSTKF